MRFYRFAMLMSAMGMANAGDVPKALSYHGQAIDALCFLTLGDSFSKSNKIDLSKCGMSAKKYVLDEQNDFMKKKGFLGYDWKETNVTYPSHGYSYYKYFDAGQGEYWIYAVNNTGGTGSFSALMLVKRTNEKTLEFKTYLGGDRCNGGIADVEINASSQLKVAVNLTPYDIYNPTGETTKLKAYDDLAACAVCCIARANYEVNKDNSKFKSISLNEVKSIDELPDQGNYQQCFNQLYMTYLKNGQKTLTQEQARSFIQQFVKACVK